MLKNSDLAPAVDLELVWGPVQPLDASQTADRQTLIRMLTSSAAEVLKMSGAQPRSERVIGDLSVAALIGFTGAGTAGALGLAASEEVLNRLYRSSVGAKGGENERCDWLREVANQILGRLKGQLLARGVTIHMALPQSIRGMRLVPHHDRTRHVAWTLIVGDQGPLLVWLDVEHIERLALDKNPPILAQPAGQVLIF